MSNELLGADPSTESEQPKEQPSAFGDFLRTLGRIADAEAIIRQTTGESTDRGDIMRDVLAMAEEKLRKAKEAREQTP